MKWTEGTRLDDGLGFMVRRTLRQTVDRVRLRPGMRRELLARAAGVTPGRRGGQGYPGWARPEGWGMSPDPRANWSSAVMLSALRCNQIGMTFYNWTAGCALL